MSDDNIAGRMNQRVTLQQKVLTPDGGGGSSVVWQDVATLWAEVVPMRTSEPFTHDKLTLRNQHRITIRYRSDISGDKRFLFGARILQIAGISNIDEKKHLIEIIASEEI